MAALTTGKLATRGTMSQVSAAAPSVTRLAAIATPVSRAAWARKGPAMAPRRVAAASPVRKVALTRPRTALGMTRCIAVCGITSDIEPNMPTATAAGSAVVSDDEVNSPKYAAAVAVRLTVSRMRGCTRSRSRRMTGAPSRKPTPRQDNRNPVCSLPPSRWTPRGMSTAPSDALASRKMTVTGNSALATGWRRSARTPSTRSRATWPIVVFRSARSRSGRDVMNMAAADSR